MKKMKKVLTLIRVNWRTMAGFEILYKMISMTVFTPLFWGILAKDCIFLSKTSDVVTEYVKMLSN